MNITQVVRGTTLGVFLIAAAACGPSAEGRRTADSVAAATDQGKVATQAGEVLSSRREAQPYFDAVREAFVAKDRRAARKGLSDAAEFTRGQADSATEPAKKALDASADELTRLAARVSTGSVQTVKTLDHAFARAHLAEAQLHCTRALEAWKNTKAGATAAEIVMLTDHFERAAADAGKPLSASARQAVETARSLAERLTRVGSVPPADVETSLGAMDKEVHRLMATAPRD